MTADDAHPADAGFAPLAHRATEIVAQLRDGDWDGLRADWDDAMRDALPIEKLTAVWEQLLHDAGRLQSLGRSTVRREGPYRIAELPLTFEHGQMKARVVFNRRDGVAGLFILLPDAP